jgi:hypothetical protein
MVPNTTNPIPLELHELKLNELFFPYNSLPTQNSLYVTSKTYKSFSVLIDFSKSPFINKNASFLLQLFWFQENDKFFDKCNGLTRFCCPLFYLSGNTVHGVHKMAGSGLFFVALKG